MQKESPLQKQVRLIKEKHPDATCIFRCMDFFECFGDCAVKVAGALDLPLTKRNGIPLTGGEWHKLDQYIPVLVRKIGKLAVCEVLEKPTLPKHKNNKHGN